MSRRIHGVEGQFSRVYPSLCPLPCNVRQVRRQLARQDAVADLQALLLLCPCAQALLGQYAARDTCSGSDSCSLMGIHDSNLQAVGSASLLQRLMRLNQHPTFKTSWGTLQDCYIFHPIMSSQWEKNVSTFRLCCQSALAAGSVPRLLFTQHRELSDSVFSGGGARVLLPLLLRYAARYSNAACMEAVYMQTKPWSRGKCLAPQHLAMAAGRTDPWAPGVVILLMQLLHPKQLKPSHMRPAYKAAAMTGHLPVLALLLRHAATAPAQHVQALLQAVADSGNAVVAELLLRDTAAALAHLQGLQVSSSSTVAELLVRDTAEVLQHLQMQQQRHVDHKRQGEVGLAQHGRQQPAGQAQQTRHDTQVDVDELVVSVQQLRQAWDSLAVPDQLITVSAVLPSAPQHYPVTAADLAADSMRLRLADLLLQRLPADRQNLLSRRLRGGLVLRTQHIKQKAAGGPGLKCRDTGKCASRLCWQLQHTMVPAFRAPAAYCGCLRDAMTRALELGTAAGRQMAALLHRELQQQLNKLSAQGVRVRAVTRNGSKFADVKQQNAEAAVYSAMSVIEGRLAGACAACDAAAVAQLEKLYMLCYLLLTADVPMSGRKRPATATTVAPTLPVSLVGGRVVTVAHPSAGLGLPWGFLESLLTAAGYDELGFAVRDGAPSTTKTGCSSIEEQLADAMLAAQDPATARQQRKLILTEQPGLGLSSTASLLTFSTRQYLLQHRTGRDNTEPTELDILALSQDPSYQFRQGVAFEAGLQQLSSQQEQQGPPPLWQQALLQVVAQQAVVLRSTNTLPMPAQPFKRWAGLQAPSVSHRSSLLLHGLQAGGSAQEVQEFVSAVLLQPIPADGFQPPAQAIWGPTIIRYALLHGAHELLSWSLQPECRDALWGAGPEAVHNSMAHMYRYYQLTPISTSGTKAGEPHADPNPLPLTPQQQQLRKDEAEMQQQRVHILGPLRSGSSSCGPTVCAAGPLPQFAANAAQLAMTLLQQPGTPPDTFSRWLESGVRSDSSLPDLVCARAVVAAVAASDVIPVGAREVYRGAIKQVVLVGDPDLWSAVLLWSHRLAMPTEGRGSRQLRGWGWISAESAQLR